MTKSVEKIRYRFNVPEDDRIVTTWMDKQHDKSLSIRLLIKKQVAECGYDDIFSNLGFGEIVRDHSDRKVQDVNEEPTIEQVEEVPQVKNNDALERLRRMQGGSSQNMANMKNLLNE